MTTLTINSDNAMQDSFGILRELYQRHRYLKLNIKIGKARSLDQNAISHCWYEQLARELREYDELGWKCHCKLNYGVPILRAEDEQFREFYDSTIKDTLTYEQKIQAMKYLPVTSLMTKPQLSKYLETMQEAFVRQGVVLEFPKEEAKV